jgi:hypothetical protein
MSTMLIVVLMILIAGLPVSAGWWYYRVKHAAPGRLLPAALLAGLAAVLLAAAAQLAIAPLTPQPDLTSGAKPAILYKIFVEIATTEELARFLALLVFSPLFKKSMERSGQNKSALMRTFGMLAGFSFAAIETVFFTITSPGSELIRAISAAPLHGACGIRAATAALHLKETPALSAFSLVFAIALHGVYNFLSQRGGPFAYLGVALAVSAFISSAQKIHFEHEAPPAPPTGLMAP